MGQDALALPSVSIDIVTLGVIDQFTYLGSTITSNLSLDADIRMRIAKAAAVMTKLNKRVMQHKLDRKH